MRWWPVLKAVFGIGLVGFVGWQFSRDLAKLPPRAEPVGYGWLALSAALYLAGLGLSGVFWLRLMRHLDARPGRYRAVRAYYVSQLGKYAPGKALALILRVGMVRGDGTPAATAALAAFYEVLTTMAAGALLALALAPVVVPADAAGLVWGRLWDLDAPHDPTRAETALMALTLLAATALPLTPWLFNRLAAGVTRRFGMVTPPAVHYGYLLEGLATIVPCWALFALALACGLAAVPEVAVGWTPATLGWLAVCMAIAYVGGFVVPTPGGLGGREFLLLLLLVPVLVRHGTPAEAAGPTVSLVVLLLRLAWTVGEVILAGCLYLVPPPRGAP
ncbi:MAG: lysylphosphatidylglycerol synthase domain-containing protein [Gemmataceae bacterium]